MHPSRYVGFYWTLPVPWVQFDALPKDVDAAAAISKTILYQRDRVRRWVKKNDGELVAERVFLELAPDRATEHVATAVAELSRLCREQQAEVIHVEFQERHSARPHPFLREALQKARLEACHLPPDPMLIDGEEFDPIEHFRAWKSRYGDHLAGKPAAAQGLLGEIHQLREAGMTWKAVADDFNARGFKTLNGKPWSEGNIRKFAASHIAQDGC